MIQSNIFGTLRIARATNKTANGEVKATRPIRFLCSSGKVGICLSLDDQWMLDEQCFKCYLWAEAMCQFATACNKTQ